MVKITGLAIQNVGPYEDKATFKINPGISVIYGLNRSSGKQSKNSNWVGKSLLFSTLSEVLYEEPIIGAKQDRITKGTQEVYLKDTENNIEYCITKKDNKYKITSNGEDLSFVTGKKGPKQFIEQLWPLTIEEYETFVHIDTRIPHPLVMGSTAIRKEFFTKFFSLDKIDAERKLYLSELNKLAGVQDSFNTLKATFNLLKADALNKSQIAALEKEVSALEQQQSAMKNKMLEMQEKQRLIEFIDNIKQDYDKLISEGLKTEESIRDKRDYCQSNINELSRKNKLALQYRDYCILSKAYDTAYEKLTDFEKSISFEKAKEGNRRYIKLFSDIEDLETEIDALEKKYKHPVSKPDDCPFTLEEVTEKRLLAKNAYNNSLKFGSGTCPTCGQPVKVDIEQLKKDLYIANNNYDIFKEYEKTVAEFEDYTKTASLIAEYKEKLESKKASLAKYEKYVDAYKHLAALPDKPEPFNNTIYDVDDITDQLNKARRDYDFYSRMLQFASRIEAYSELKDKTIDRSIFDKYNEVSTNYFSKKTKLEDARVTYSKVINIRDKLREMKTQLQDVEPLEYLVDLFQDKTLKKRIIQIIGNRLMNLVNKYASLAFNEDYKFSLEWETSQINIICKRKAGKRELVSDVRKLSGAESKLFTIIMVIALLSFVPKEKRPSVMILDEPTAVMSQETIASFYELLKILQQLVESIIIITPKSEDVYSGARCFTILREGTSRIVEGHPSDI